MKKHLIIFVMLSAFMVGSIGCSAQDQVLTELVNEINKEMPLSLGAVGEVTRMAVEDGFLHMKVAVNEDLVNLDALSTQPEVVQNGMKDMVVNRALNGTEALFEELVETSFGFKLTYIGKTSGKNVVASISNAEIRKIVDNTKKSSPEDLLESQLKLTNAQMPNDLGYGMVMTKVERVGDYIVYFVEVDDDMFSLLNDMQAELREGMAEELKSDDPSVAMMKKVSKAVNCGIGYRYYGKTSGKAFELLFPVNEL